jgi:hypothetical protein
MMNRLRRRSGFDDPGQEQQQSAEEEREYDCAEKQANVHAFYFHTD